MSLETFYERNGDLMACESTSFHVTVTITYTLSQRDVGLVSRGNELSRVIAHTNSEGREHTRPTLLS